MISERELRLEPHRVTQGAQGENSPIERRPWQKKIIGVVG